MHGDQPILTIRGKKVGLGPIRRDLLHLHVTWANDPEVTVPLGGWAGPSTIEDQEAWYARDSKRNEKRIVYLIYELSTMRPIGCTDLRDVNYRYQTAMFDIFIGEKDCWGKGYATETASLMLKYGFEELGLHTIKLQVVADNERAIRAYTRAGFTVTGRQREVIRRPNGRIDLVLMDCLAHEFRAEP